MSLMQDSRNLRMSIDSRHLKRSTRGERFKILLSLLRTINSLTTWLTFCILNSCNQISFRKLSNNFVTTSMAQWGDLSNQRSRDNFMVFRTHFHLKKKTVIRFRFKVGLTIICIIYLQQSKLWSPLRTCIARLLHPTSYLNVLSFSGSVDELKNRANFWIAKKMYRLRYDCLLPGSAAVLLSQS